MCGEQRSFSSCNETALRSSPRVRGTARTSGSTRSITVHPRVCGEQRRAGCGNYPPNRFIPACAGNRLPSSMIPGAGRNSDRVTRAWRGTGSCPPARAGNVIGSTRFIPACAGNSGTASERAGVGLAVHPRVCGEQRASASMMALSVHPRVCGEQITPYPVLGTNSGSSPRVRGTGAAADRQWSAKTRFIPACAGNRTFNAIPRACTAHSSSAALARHRFIPACAGNSPRNRRLRVDAYHRFIPACAGNRLPPSP